MDDKTDHKLQTHNGRPGQHWFMKSELQIHRKIVYMLEKHLKCMFNGICRDKRVQIHFLNYNFNFQLWSQKANWSQLKFCYHASYSEGRDKRMNNLIHMAIFKQLSINLRITITRAADDTQESTPRKWFWKALTAVLGRWAIIFPQNKYSNWL